MQTNTAITISLMQTFFHTFGIQTPKFFKPTNFNQLTHLSNMSLIRMTYILGELDMIRQGNSGAAHRSWVSKTKLDNLGQTWSFSDVLIKLVNLTKGSILEQSLLDHAVYCWKWTLTFTTTISFARRSQTVTQSLLSYRCYFQMDPYVLTLMKDGLDEVLTKEDGIDGKCILSSQKRIIIYVSLKIIFERSYLWWQENYRRKMICYTLISCNMRWN